MLWEEAIEEAKHEMGITGWCSDWNSVMELAKKIISEDASIKARIEHLIYLKSNEWKQLREQILIRDKYQCQDCLEVIPSILKQFEKLIPPEFIFTKKASEVHHLNYDCLHTDYEAESCISLCNICHTLRHAHTFKYQETLIKSREDMLFNLIYLLLLDHPAYVQEAEEQKRSFIKSLTENPSNFLNKEVQFGRRNNS